jgi:hypothetical protein
VDSQTVDQASGTSQETQLATAIDNARDELMKAARLADELKAGAVHTHVLSAATNVDDALTALSDGVAR